MQPPLSNCMRKVNWIWLNTTTNKTRIEQRLLPLGPNSNVCARIGQKSDIRIEALGKIRTCKLPRTTHHCIVWFHLRGPAEATDDGRQISSIAPLHVFLLWRLRFAGKRRCLKICQYESQDLDGEPHMTASNSVEAMLDGVEHDLDWLVADLAQALARSIECRSPPLGPISKRRHNAMSICHPQEQTPSRAHYGPKLYLRPSAGVSRRLTWSGQANLLTDQHSTLLVQAALRPTQCKLAAGSKARPTASHLTTFLVRSTRRMPRTIEAASCRVGQSINANGWIG